MNVITRFAPSPTGILHTGSARTALFNWLFARKHNGKFFLRIEDTDKDRSTNEFRDAILHDLEWLGLKWDGDVVYQLERQKRHMEIAHELVKRGKAYFCFTSEQELEEFRNRNPHEKFLSAWRNKGPSESPPHMNPAVRLKVNHEGSTTIADEILGEITFSNNELDDTVLLRSDGTPTYMLAVVVDDHDMGITHIIRGDDHLSNAFRQKQIYEAMEWHPPVMAHIPLIHDKDGKKLSKREGALGIDAYEKLGYLPEAVINHLLRLGWGYEDEEIISLTQAIEWFSLKAIGKSAARFDINKLNFINAHYMRALSNTELFEKMKPFLKPNLSPEVLKRIELGLEGLKVRANTLKELAEGAEIYINKKDILDAKSNEILSKLSNDLIEKLYSKLGEQSGWDKDTLHDICEKFATENSLKISFIMQVLRALVLGTFAAPGIFEVIEILGKEETLKRINSRH